MNIKGGCYCNEIRYESKGEVQASIQCHCRECQYITGGNPNVIMIMPVEGFKFVSGKPKEFKRSDLENAVTRLFRDKWNSNWDKKSNETRINYFESWYV